MLNNTRGHRLSRFFGTLEEQRWNVEKDTPTSTTNTVSPGYNLLNEREDLVPGGKGDTTPYSSLDPLNLKVGAAVEREHTGSTKLAKEIASDHLTENPRYYQRLGRAHLIDEPRAMRLLRRAASSR